MVAGAKHEVVDEQLAAAVEQLIERLLAVVRVEAVFLLHTYPGQLASLPRQLVPKPRVLLLASEQLVAGGRPLLAAYDAVISHVCLRVG
jgi:hypothetical protein